jgi:parallel beta-helix repeat protein
MILGSAFLCTLDQTLAGVDPGARSSRAITVNPATSSAEGIGLGLDGAQGSQGKVVSADEQSGHDLGAKIASADAALSLAAGVIKVTGSGQISDKVTLSEHHTLSCGNNVTLTLASPNAGIVQRSDTTISGCTMASRLPHQGAAIFSQGTQHVQVEDVSFTGGGYHVEYNTVSNFVIKNTHHLSVTTLGASPISVVTSSHGQIDSPRIEAYTVTAGNSGVRLIGIKKSSFIDVINPVLNGVDATTVPGCGGVTFTATTNSTVRGGHISGLKNCDGVLVESSGSDASSEIAITGTISSGNNSARGAGDHHANGEGFDIFNSRHVQLSQVTAQDNGRIPGMRQPGIEVSNSIDVTISECTVTNNGGEGIRVDGSPGVTIKDFHTNHNGAAGILVMPAFGNVDATRGSAMVKWAPGSANMTFSAVWPPQTKIAISKGVYTVAKLQSTGDLTLTTNFAEATGVYGYNVDSFVQLENGESLDNGQLHKGQPPNQGVGEREGVYFSGGRSGEVLGHITQLRAGDTQREKTQTYGIRVENQARILASGVSASGNLFGGVRDSPGRSKIQTVR